LPYPRRPPARLPQLPPNQIQLTLDPLYLLRGDPCSGFRLSWWCSLWEQWPLYLTAGESAESWNRPANKISLSPIGQVPSQAPATSPQAAKLLRRRTK